MRCLLSEADLKSVGPALGADAIYHFANWTVQSARRDAKRGGKESCPVKVRSNFITHNLGLHSESVNSFSCKSIF